MLSERGQDTAMVEVSSKEMLRTGLALQNGAGGGAFWLVSRAKLQNHYSVHTQNLEPWPGMFWKLPVHDPWIGTVNI